MRDLEFTQRPDGKFNVWQWVPSKDLVYVDGEQAMTWQVVKVCDTKADAYNALRELKRK